MRPNLGVFVLNCFDEINLHKFAVCTAEVVIIWEIPRPQNTHVLTLPGDGALIFILFRYMFIVMCNLQAFRM